MEASPVSLAPLRWQMLHGGVLHVPSQSSSLQLLFLFYPFYARIALQIPLSDIAWESGRFSSLAISIAQPRQPPAWRTASFSSGSRLDAGEGNFKIDVQENAWCLFLLA